MSEMCVERRGDVGIYWIDFGETQAIVYVYRCEPCGGLYLASNLQRWIVPDAVGLHAPPFGSEKDAPWICRRAARPTLERSCLYQIAFSAGSKHALSSVPWLPEHRDTVQDWILPPKPLKPRLDSSRMFLPGGIALQPCMGYNQEDAQILTLSSLNVGLFGKNHTPSKDPPVFRCWPTKK